jgi:hypothetical protein
MKCKARRKNEVILYDFLRFVQKVRKLYNQTMQGQLESVRNGDICIQWGTRPKQIVSECQGGESSQCKRGSLKTNTKVR